MRTITTTWLTIVYIFMNPVSVGGAQTQFQHFAPWNPTILPVSSPDGTLKVQIQMQGTGCNWTFGARAETSPPGFLASEVLFSPPPQGMPIPPGVGIVGSIRDLAGVATGRGYVRADVPCQLSRDVILYVSVPPGVLVTLERNGITIAAGIPNPSLWVFNGSVISGEAKGRQTLLAMITQGGPSPGETPPDLQQARDGTYFASLAALRKNAISLTEPDSTKLPSGRRSGVAALEIRIDQTGAVTAVTARPGAEEIYGVFERSIRVWRFRPFLKDGKPVAVKAILPFVIREDGSAHTPISVGGSN